MATDARPHASRTPANNAVHDASRHGHEQEHGLPRMSQAEENPSHHNDEPLADPRFCETRADDGEAAIQQTAEHQLLVDRRDASRPEGQRQRHVPGNAQVRSLDEDEKEQEQRCADCSGQEANPEWNGTQERQGGFFEMADSPGQPPKAPGTEGNDPPLRDGKRSHRNRPDGQPKQNNPVLVALRSRSGQRMGGNAGGHDRQVLLSFL